MCTGNVQPNPGPELQCVQTPSDSESLSGLKIVHHMVRIWAKSVGADIVAADRY